MSWFPSFFAPGAAWLFALLIPVIVFYFLKLRRDRVEIPSLALWRQVIHDQRVNAPFQKFKRNLLLLLQLLLLCLIVLAAMQPFFPGNAEDVQYLPILIDSSASMSARDANGKSRLDLAKEEVLKVIDGLLPGQQLSLIAVGGTVRSLTDFTDNQPQLRKALDELQAEDLPSRIDDGLRLCQALARTRELERVRFYSDGNLPTRPNPATGEPIAQVDVDLSLKLDFLQIPSAGPNLGITAFNARRSGPDSWDVFLRVEGSTAGSSEGDLTLTANGEVVGQERVIVSPGESQRLAFRVPSTGVTRLEAAIVPRGHDALASDNRAWLNLPVGRLLTVFCPESLGLIRHALDSIPGLLVEPQPGRSLEGNSFDVVISDKLADESLQAPLKLIIGQVPADLAADLQISEGADEVIDWRRDTELLQHVRLKGVILSDLVKKTGNLPDPEIETRGYDLLAFGTEAPLLLRKRDGTSRIYFMLFHPERSTLPYRVGFPVLVSNLVREGIDLASLGEVQGETTGVLSPLQVSASGEYEVVTPSGGHERRRADDQGLLAGIEASRVGLYEIRSGEEEIERIGAALLNPGETSLAAVDRIHFNELSVSAAGERLQEDRPLWPKFALAALCLLLLEWWYFQRRPAGLRA